MDKMRSNVVPQRLLDYQTGNEANILLEDDVEEDDTSDILSEDDVEEDDTGDILPKDDVKQDDMGDILPKDDVKQDNMGDILPKDDVKQDHTGVILSEDDAEEDDTDLSAEERIFLQDYPTMKRELEEDIRNHRALADDIERTQETLMKTNVVTDSVAVASGVMSVLGLALAPVTAGGSLILSAAGTGVGTAAGFANMITSFWGRHRMKNAQAKVTSEVSTHDKGVGQAVQVTQALYNLGKNTKYVERNIRALKIAKANPRLASAAKRLLTTGQVSARRATQVEKAFKGTPLAMKNGTRLLGGATAALCLGLDIYSLWKDWKQLKDTEKVELAEELRAIAAEQDEKLRELTKIYRTLKQKEERLRGSFSEGATRTLP